MAGLAEVADGQAGTGLAWMGPGSTFNPTKYAMDVFNAKVEKQGADQKKQDDLNKLADFTPGEQFNIDLTTKTTRGIKGLQNYAAGITKNNKGWNYETQQELVNRTNGLKLMDQQLQTQYKDYGAVKKIVDSDKGKELSTDKMNQNLAYYENPEHFIGTTQFDEKYKPGYDAIKEKLSKDPYYQANPDELTDDARIVFRNQYKDDLLGTVLKPESVFKIIKDNEDALYNTLTSDQEKNGVTIKEVSNDRGQRKVTFSDGSVKLIDGTDKTAEDLYNGSVDYKRSIKTLYEDLPEDARSKYTNSQDPALDWFKDTVNSTAGDVTTSRRVEKTGDGNTINFGGGYSANSPYNITPYEVDQRINRTSTVGDNTTTRGFSVKKGSTELTLKDVSPPVFFKSNSSAQTEVPAGTTVTLDGVSPFKAPAFNGNLTFGQLRQELINKKSWDDFDKEFGEKYKDAELGGNLNGIILTDKEVKFLQSAGLGKYIKDKKFAKGALSYWKPGIGPDEPATMERYSDAIMPLESIAPSIESETNIDFNRALDQFPDMDYNIFTKDAKDVTGGKKEKVVVVGEDYVPSSK